MVRLSRKEEHVFTWRAHDSSENITKGSLSARATSAGLDMCSCDLQAKPESLAASRKDGRHAKEIQYMLLGENGCTHLGDNPRNYDSHGDARLQLRLILSAEEEQG